MPNDSVETSAEMILFLEPLIEKFKFYHRKLNILDPCFCHGASIENFRQFDYVNLIHNLEMNVNCKLEVKESNLEYYLGLNIDMIVTNPPFSSAALAQVLEILCKVADIKKIPLLFILPQRCTVTERFYKTMNGKKLVRYPLPNMNFRGFTGAGHLDNRTLSWYGYNLHQAGDYFIVRKPTNKIIL
jgi:hypothetical protein